LFHKKSPAIPAGLMFFYAFVKSARAFALAGDRHFLCHFLNGHGKTSFLEQTVTFDEL